MLLFQSSKYGRFDDEYSDKKKNKFKIQSAISIC